MTNEKIGITAAVKRMHVVTVGRQMGLVVALGAIAATMVGCRSDMAAVQQAPIVDGNAASDPANANMAAPMVSTAVQPGYDAAQAARNGYAPRNRYTSRTRVAGESYSEQQQGYAETYPAQNNRATRNEAYNYNTQAPQGYDNGQYSEDDDQLYSDLLDPNVAVVQQPPPPLPEYQQPVAPGPDYLWTPGYWNYANAGYYYVPGNWVSAPFVGALWTPGWWGYTGRGYGWHRGYWGRHVGYYGGVNYGFGFIGVGYQGGYWNNDHFLYNRDCNHVDPRSVNNYVYERNISVGSNNYVNNSRVSYYGGQGGLQRRPMPAEFAAQRETHIAPLPAQMAERQAAAQNRQQFFNDNHGRPQQLFAAHPVIERNVNVPTQLARPQQGGVAGQPNGFGQRQNAGNPALQQEQMQHQGGQQQQVASRQQAMEQQRGQMDQAREMQQQRTNFQQQANQQRQQQDQARQQQQRTQQDQQGRQQQAAMQNQQRVQQQNQQRIVQPNQQQNDQRVQQQRAAQQQVRMQQMQQGVRPQQEQRIAQQQNQQQRMVQEQQQRMVQPQAQQQQRATPQFQQRAIPQQQERAVPQQQQRVQPAQPHVQAQQPAPRAAEPGAGGHEHGH